MRLKSDLLLFLAAVIWGSAFVAQRLVANSLGVFLFNGSRFFVGALVLLLISRFRWRIERKFLPLVILAGGLLFAASGLQQAGLQTTTAGNAGFITGLYVVFVPVVLSIFWKQNLTWSAWIASFLAVAGLFLLSTGGRLSDLVEGDVYELAGAVLWAFHIIIISRAVSRMDALSFSIGQFIVCGLLNMLAGFSLESETLAGFQVSLWSIVYTGVFSVGVAYTLQAIGQKHSPPADASIILSLEAVFAALFGFHFLGERLSGEQLAGCVLILAAIILAQINPKPEIVPAVGTD